MSGIYVSSGAFHGARLAEMAEACESIGAGLELSSGIRWHPGLDGEIEEVARRKGRVLVHNYFPPPEKPFVLNLASTDPDTLDRGKQHVRASIDLSARFGAPFYSVHSGFAMNLKAEDLGHPEAQAQLEKIPCAEAYRIFLNTVREMSAYAKSRGLRLLIENNVITRQQLSRESPLLMIEPAEIARFLRELDDANVGLLLDVGHAKVSAAALGFAPQTFFKQLPVSAIHASDNDGIRDNNQPFGEDAWFWPHCPPDAPLVIEVYGIGIDAARELVQLAKRRRPH
ncbi:MAG: TIM barrel protein [Chthoniobacteraceae bacterium]|jgi:sugar phosphate isomerase/epimerase